LIVSVLLSITLKSAIGLAGSSQSPEKRGVKPNVIVVLTDDQGYGELSFHGNPILKTPNLDELAGQSLRFTDFHVAPMCAPTRGQLLSGIDAARNGVINVSCGRELLRPELPTMADIFAGNGYNTGIFGKWHLGSNYPFRPEDRGFQKTLWFPNCQITSLADFWGNDYFDDTYTRNGKQESFEGYCTDIFFDEAMEFMSSSAKAGKPFFTYLPTNTPHGPLNAKDEDIEAMKVAIAGSDFSDIDEGLKNRLTGYLGMIRNIDTNMGRLSEFLEKEGLAENTIVIFMTDNGSTHGNLYFNAGMRGRKAEIWEGGHRVPCFFSWPNGDFTSPRDISGLTEAQDILPTLIDLCELSTPATVDFDGISLAPVLRGKMEVPEDRMLVINYSRIPGGFNSYSPYGQAIMKREGACVLWKRWRLLEDRVLNDLITDPMQQTNVIDRYPEVAEKMREHLNDWWDEVEPLINEPQRIIIGHKSDNPTRLNACDWLDVFEDKKNNVLRGRRETGFWILDVAEAGEYEIELRRWPREIDVPLTGSPPGGVALPISRARIYVNNVNHIDLEDKSPYIFEGLSKRVSTGEKFATFTVELKQGPMALHTWFDDQDGNILFSAYYVYVNRK
jgi:arylsulfatase A-like enzyme